MKPIVLFSFLFLFSSAHAFIISKDSIPKDTAKKNASAKTEKFRKFRMGVDYSSDNTFKGRKDTVTIPIISPSFKFTAKSGLFLKANMVHVPAPKAKKKKFFDELDAGAGWNFDFSDDWDGSISYTHYFFDSKVARLKAAVQNDANAAVGYDWNILYSRILFDYNSGNPNLTYKGKKITKRTKDFSVTFTNVHDFEFTFRHKQMLTLSPEADVLFGTQNFLAAYKGQSDTTKYQKQASAFNLTAYIFYATVSYEIKKFTFLLDPSYTIPQNLPQGESSKPYFIMSGSIYVTFKSKSKK
ncbi:MAG: hypothetical protein HY063_01390 [Bacteroidetes bacterium]|nr:hypothetical protein [Bacteroidota bacterium]